MNKQIHILTLAIILVAASVQGAALVVEKTAETFVTHDYLWSIEKTASPDSWTLFEGDAAMTGYQIEVIKSGPETSYRVEGEITIHNPDENPTATIESVVDVISGGLVAEVECGVDFPFYLPAGETLTCSYVRALPNNQNRLNTVTVTTSGDVEGGIGLASVLFRAPTIETNLESITVEDTNGDSWVFDDSGTVNYPRAFNCDWLNYEDEYATYTHRNTVTIVETGQSDYVDVMVECYQLDFLMMPRMSYDRTYLWTIDKSADSEHIILDVGESRDVEYLVIVEREADDDNFGVYGEIIITNPSPRDAVLTEVTDVLEGIEIPVYCPELIVHAMDSLVCTFSSDLENGEDIMNVGTATQQNFHFFGEDEIPSGTTNYTRSVGSGLGSPSTVLDECVDVSDTNVGFLGTACHDDFYYYTLGFSYDRCGNYDEPNTASFITEDTGDTGEASWMLTVEVPCVEDGCTLTQGYWKTHSTYGPAPYDDTWARVEPDEEDTVFYLSEQSWYHAFWTSSSRNKYYSLAHQFMAASLNVLNGASTPDEVDDAMDDADELFNEYEPEDIRRLPGNNPLRQ
ncbi:MAG: hypothetical protein ABIH34_04560 [Nanoarchaeota archaeon]